MYIYEHLIINYHLTKTHSYNVCESRSNIETIILLVYQRKQAQKTTHEKRLLVGVVSTVLATQLVAHLAQLATELDHLLDRLLTATTKLSLRRRLVDV